jgi:hypothetical protein
MGWKNVKEYYDIKHIVQVTIKGICIGSSYIHDIIIIDKNSGEMIKPYTDQWAVNDDLLRYQTEMEQDPEKLKSLVTSEDSFEKNILVYTYENSKIIEEYCEELGWPNVTHSGNIMYENTYSTNKDWIIEQAIKDAELRVKMFSQQVAEYEEKLKERNSLLKEAIDDLSVLNKSN